MDLGKSFAWILFLAVVVGAGSLGHHKEGDAPSRPQGPAVQLAAPAPTQGGVPMTSTVAMESTHAMVTRTSVRMVK